MEGKKVYNYIKEFKKKITKYHSQWSVYDLQNPFVGTKVTDSLFVDRAKRQSCSPEDSFKDSIGSLQAAACI